MQCSLASLPMCKEFMRKNCFVDKQESCVRGPKVGFLCTSTFSELQCNYYHIFHFDLILCLLCVCNNRLDFPRQNLVTHIQFLAFKHHLKTHLFQATVNTTPNESLKYALFLIMSYINKPSRRSAVGWLYPPARPVSHTPSVTSRFRLAHRRTVRALRLRPAPACPTAHVSHAPGQIHNPIIIYRLCTYLLNIKIT